MAGYCMGCGAMISTQRGLCSLCGSGVLGQREAVATVYRPTVLDAHKPETTGLRRYSKVWNAMLLGMGVLVAIPILLIGSGLVTVPLYKLPPWLRGEGGVISLPSSIAKRVAADVDQMGLPVFPGAQQGRGGLQMKQGSGTILSAVYSTYAPTDEVAEFYKRTLGSGVIETVSPEGSELKQARGDTDELTITLTRGAGSMAGKTQILVLETKMGEDGISAPQVPSPPPVR